MTIRDLVEVPEHVIGSPAVTTRADDKRSHKITLDSQELDTEQLLVWKTWEQEKMGRLIKHADDYFRKTLESKLHSIKDVEVEIEERARRIQEEFLQQAEWDEQDVERAAYWSAIKSDNEEEQIEVV